MLLLRGTISKTNECTKLLEVGADGARIAVDADNGGRAHILHYTYRVTLWCL